MRPNLDTMDHVAISVAEIEPTLKWYRRTFQCDIIYQDETWALVQFANIKLALVAQSQHPPHLGFVTPQASSFGQLTDHRDGTKSVYVKDPSGNSVELLDNV
jgi:catechol 2,3-dioxygenase-like lactoylglutathione lyase family enzyme